jgi:hypothetical protein
MLAVYFKVVLHHVQLPKGHLVGTTTDNASSNYLMIRELKSTLEDSGIVWPALRNHIPCMAHVIQLGIGAFMSSLGL